MAIPSAEVSVIFEREEEGGCGQSRSISCRVLVGLCDCRLSFFKPCLDDGNGPIVQIQERHEDTNRKGRNRIVEERKLTLCTI